MSAEAARLPAPDPASEESDRKDDLISLPMSELKKRLGTSGDGLSQAEASKRLAQYGP